MKDKIILVTKDAMCCDYLPVYGNIKNHTPNIDELAKKGTIFERHYTGAASTIMANMCMFTGLYPFQSDMSDYVRTNATFKGLTLFDKASRSGYKCHIIWDEAWYKAKTIEYYNCYGRDTIFHSISEMRQGVGGHYKRLERLKNDLLKQEAVLNKISNLLESITRDEEPIFVWLHIPHVINGCVGYGQDINVFDEIVGIVRRFFPDEGIFVSSDHGNMNGKKGKISYGYDVYEQVSKIPLIAPKINGQDRISSITSNVDLFSILFEHVVTFHKYVYCDTAFYTQAHRKLAIISYRYKYIYNKATKAEELYDLIDDPGEECNLINDFILYPERINITLLSELYPYDNWNELPSIRQDFRKEFAKIWRKGNFFEESKAKFKYFIKMHYFVPKLKRKMKKIRININNEQN